LFSEFTYNRLSAFDLQARKLTVIAGNGDLRSSGDGGRATEAGITVPYCFTLDVKRNIVVCDSNHCIRRISAGTGIIATIAGSGRRGSRGDGGPALDAEFVTPLSVALDPSGNLYVADDTSNRIRRVDSATGIIETIAGSGPPTTGTLSGVEFSGEGELAVKSRLASPRSLAFDHDGNLLFVTAGRVCRIDKQGYLRTIAGVGQDGFGGDGGPATKARINPSGITVDDGGNVFLAEYVNNRIRRIDANSGIITTIGGNGLPKRPPQRFM
jgi:DNA-binding beta-propeller fold protein YncE